MRRLTPAQQLIQWHDAIRDHPITRLIDEICNASKQNKTDARAETSNRIADAGGGDKADSVHGDDLPPTE